MTEDRLNENEMQQSSGGTEISQLITRAIKDPEFKKQLLNDPDSAMEEYELTEVQKLMVKTLREEDLNKLTVENLEEFFSADSAVYTPSLEGEMETDIAGEDDI
ncbi:Nitrile hydratase alpha chain [Ruminiclostridium papyrosolvens DSM 2782]|uniref:Nitrile hydratase alpha chain n=1 Tax=Ruminiclostridium papyrosolvens DSM 2782 TaxID=588581 RepID=F1TF60_9FIRM|nr:Os1348 family NHLP clan protein [Ruminiclostridium papyrosolvens]EGD46998.1 Nitrile hydratase alpha chain [Ruminiclostridium papyrosolvens DSM 2782]WES33753.1 Os1348 family NHLP clan protein [Ruminiclostridium papyrosolvens DSM 2782]